MRCGDSGAYVQTHEGGLGLLLLRLRRQQGSTVLGAAPSRQVSVVCQELPLQCSLTASVASQYSLYGATKKSDEMITHTYYHMYGINCVGLRFFTVYGPWGRPDMAYFAFALAIAQNKTITVTKGDIKRDFTYVDDIAEGVVRATLRPTAAYDIFNLGNGRPEKLIDLVHLVEQGMGRKAEKKWRDIPPGDVPATFANVSHAHDVLGYASTTNLDVGISKFMKWFNSPVNPILPLLRAGSQHTATA